MFIPMAYAASGAPAPDSSNPLLSLLLPLGIGLFFWFLIIRPQSKQAKLQKQLQEGLQKGDEVITNSGLLGRVASVSEQYLSIEIARGVEVQLQRNAVQSVLPKGTFKI